MKSCYRYKVALVDNRDEIDRDQLATDGLETYHPRALQRPTIKRPTQYEAEYTPLALSSSSIKRYDDKKSGSKKWLPKLRRHSARRQTGKTDNLQNLDGRFARLSIYDTQKHDSSGRSTPNGLQHSPKPTISITSNDFSFGELLDDRQGMNSSDQQFTKAEQANRASIDGISMISEFRFDDNRSKSNKRRDRRMSRAVRSREATKSSSPSPCRRSAGSASRHKFLCLRLGRKSKTRNRTFAKLQLSILNSGIISLKTFNKDVRYFLPRGRLTIKEFEKRISLMRRYEILPSIEYRFACRYETYVCKHALAQSNLPKNTSKKCIPYDYNRVVLKTVANMKNSDYINASHIDSCLKPNAYIAAQGPNENTVEDFWRMVWEQKSFVIAMLTKAFDFIRVMCEQYWPVELNKPERYNNLEVTLLHEEPFADFVIRTIRLTKLRRQQLEATEVNERVDDSNPRININTESFDKNEDANSQADETSSECSSLVEGEIAINMKALEGENEHGQEGLPQVRAPKFVKVNPIDSADPNYTPVANANHIKSKSSRRQNEDADPGYITLDRTSATRRAMKDGSDGWRKRDKRKNKATQFQIPTNSQLLDDDEEDEEGETGDAVNSAAANHNNERIIYQYHYNSWPSHTCPFISSLLHFRRRVRICVDEMSKSGKTGPTIVHCSDGCGRTGTYLCIDANLELIDEDNLVDVFYYTRKMRQSRKFMIENLDQYKFIYDTIEEAVSCGKTWFPVPELHKRLKQKSQRNPVTKKNEYQREYEKITQMASKFSIGDCAGGHRVENREKNRDVSTVPPDSFRPYLTSFQTNDSTDYINAVFVDGYTRSKEYIVTEWPVHKTISDFWSLVYDHDCNSIVLLANPAESSTYPSFLPTEKELRRKFGPVFSAEMASYTHVQHIKSWIYTINKKIVSLTEVIAGVKSEPKTTRVFQINCWPQGHRVPTSTKALVELMNMVERWRQRTSYGPVCVVSLDGKSRAGVYCAANVAIEQVVQHGEVDVFQAVQTVRRHRPQLIENMTEYKYCYDLILHYVINYLNQKPSDT